MKKTLIISGLFLFFGIVPHVLAQGFVPLAGIPGLTQGVDTTSGGLSVFFNNLYKYLIGIAAVLAVIMIIWGGLEYATQDVPSAKQNGKDRILQAIFGLILVLSPVLVFSIINPSILNLSINLTKLDTATSTGAGGGTGSPTTGTPDPTSGCTSVIGTPGILQIALCPSAAAASKWGQTSCATGDRLSGVTTSKIVDPTTGIATTKNIVTCAGILRYVFIDQPSGTFGAKFAVNRMRPLVTTSVRPNNGNDAVNFGRICAEANLGWRTCLSDTPAFTSETDCGLTPKREWKCYTETLSCINNDNVDWKGVCSDNPSWTPFQ